eukprot:TRINITY_DN19864_c0_g1_i3.p1 TRINITY_DN19864_c0_g1~~TRINITY_DN19864_c0_g1_i3.p1  ORF type:complete len:1014 (+),score=119.31 TRINITY_DN19864_c0_g1_i3:68-3109(+)
MPNIWHAFRCKGYVALLVAFSQCVRSQPGLPGVPVVISSSAEPPETVAGSGVPLRQWLYVLQIPVPAVPAEALGGPLGLDGGNCSGLEIARIDATDLGGSATAPALSYFVSGLAIRCRIFTQGGALIVNFHLENVTARIDISVQPYTPPGATLPLPLGALTMMKCQVSSAQVKQLHFGGTDMVQPALEVGQGVIEDFVSNAIPSLACSQLKPKVEAYGTAALQQIAAVVGVLLQASPAPPVEPFPEEKLVDWGTYPPMQLGHELAKGRPEAVASLLRRVPKLQLPVQQMPVNRTLKVAVNGTFLEASLLGFSVSGIDTFLTNSLSVQGLRYDLVVGAAFEQVRTATKLQLRVGTPGGAVLSESFELVLHLSNMSSSARCLAMLGQAKLDALQVDQLQHLGCLVSCTDGAAKPPGVPLGIQELLDFHGNPSWRVEAPGSLETGIADVADTTAGAMVRGYSPTVQKALQSMIQLQQATIAGLVEQIMASEDSCSASQVYFGPGDVVNGALLWGAIGIAVLGVVCGVFVSLGRRKCDYAMDAASSTLAAHPVVPACLEIAYPFWVVGTIIIFVFSDLGLGTIVNIVFQAGDSTTTVGPAFSFSVLTIARDSIKGGAYLIATLVVGLSGIWPFAKLFMLLLAWLAPPSLLSLRIRGSWLEFLDQYGKFSLIDSWLAVLALCSYDLHWAGGGTSVQVVAVPMAPFFFFVVSTVLSLVLGHIATEYHRRALEHEGGADDMSDDDGQQRSLFSHLHWNPSLVLAFMLATGVLTLVGASVTSFSMVTSGAIADLLLEPQEMAIEFSLLSLGMFLTHGSSSPGVGLRTVQAIFFIFTLALPLLLMLMLTVLLIIPLERSAQRFLLKLCRVCDAWAALDVFALAVLVANFEFGLLAEFLVYNDNIARACSWVKAELQVECLAIECHVSSGFLFLALAGVASFGVPKLVFNLCDQALQGDFKGDLSREDSFSSAFLEPDVDSSRGLLDITSPPAQAQAAQHRQVVPADARTLSKGLDDFGIYGR